MWTVTGIGDEGALHVKHVRPPASAVPPAGNVSEDVVLGYATTIAGAKGRTVDRGHVVVTPRTASASLYVGMSPGRDSNHAHVVCDFLRIGWPVRWFTIWMVHSGAYTPFGNMRLSTSLTLRRCVGDVAAGFSPSRRRPQTSRPADGPGDHVEASAARGISSGSTPSW